VCSGLEQGAEFLKRPAENAAQGNRFGVQLNEGIIMPKHCAPSNEPEINLPPPDVIGVLPAVPGGEENLLPKDAWLSPLRVEFEWWKDPSPIPAYSDIVQLIWDDDDANPVAQKSYEGSNPPTLPPDLWLEVPATKLDEGIHTLRYRLLPWNGSTPQDSASVNLTIDKTPPALATPSRLNFPTQVLPPNTLTARYLEQNNDEVKVGLPAYTSPRPWDCITWYWGETRGNLNQGGVIELDDKNYSQPVVVTIEGQLIRDRKDGLRYAWYEVSDRAGSLSRASDPVELDVAATPIPRTLPPIKVVGATGSTSSGTLNPSNAISGATVVIPADASIHDGESVFVLWAEPGSAGAYRTGTPVTPGSGEYRIPVDKVAHHIGKTLPVRYEVIEPGVVDPHTSQLYTLRVEMFGGPPTIQCDRVAGGRLSLASIPAGDYANFTLERWTWMATDQFITVSVVGVDTSNQRLEIPVLTDSPVPEVAQKIAVGRISKSDLQRFKINLGLEIRCGVSFDGKQSYQAFPRLTPTLVT
jgi:hypothetical protein